MQIHYRNELESQTMIQNVGMMCNKVTMPSRDINTKAHITHGPRREMPYAYSYSGSVECTFIADKFLRQRAFFENWQNNSFLNLVFSGYTETTWTWNGSSYLRTYYDAYQNQNKNNIHNWLDENGNTGQISVDTVIALFCQPYVHPLQLPSVKTVGEGRAIILHGGKMLDAKWKRGSNLDPFHIADNNNNILYVPKGKVWISLVPNTKNPSFG